jgi:hypothetical protein
MIFPEWVSKQWHVVGEIRREKNTLPGQSARGRPMTARGHFNPGRVDRYVKGFV